MADLPGGAAPHLQSPAQLPRAPAGPAGRGLTLRAGRIRRQPRTHLRAGGFRRPGTSPFRAYADLPGLILAEGP